MKFSKSPGISGYTVYTIIDALCFVTWVSWFFLTLNVILLFQEHLCSTPRISSRFRGKGKGNHTQQWSQICGPSCQHFFKIWSIAPKIKAQEEFCGVFIILFFFCNVSGQATYEVCLDLYVIYMIYVRLGFLKKRKLSPGIWMNFGSSSLDLCIQSPGPTVPRALLRRMCLAAMDQNFLEAGDWTCRTWICWWWITCYRGKSQFWEDVLLFPSFSNPSKSKEFLCFR